MNNNGSSGLGPASILTIVFVVLKAVRVIDWSWWWVLSPLWIDLIVGILLIVGLIIYEIYDDKKFEKKYGVSLKKKKGNKK